MLPFGASDGPGRLPTWPEIRAFATHAEAVGLDSVWVCDHFLSGTAGRPPEGIHEGWTILAALAGCTSRVELGQLVMCVSFRSPALLAKMAVTADHVSGGRLALGLGAGWYDPEYLAFGFPTDHRAARFGEALRVIRALLRGERLTFAGQYHDLRDAVLLPPPERPIPILVAGHGPRMLRLTARYADAWNTAWYGLPDERLRRRLADLDAALLAEDRDPATLRRTVGVEVYHPELAPVAPDEPDTALVAGSAGELARALDALDRPGVDDVIVGLRPSTPPALDRLAGAIAMRAG